MKVQYETGNPFVLEKQITVDIILVPEPACAADILTIDPGRYVFRDYPAPTFSLNLDTLATISGMQKLTWNNSIVHSDLGLSPDFCGGLQWTITPNIALGTTVVAFADVKGGLVEPGQITCTD